MTTSDEVLAAAEEFRDTILNSRHELAETVEDSDQVNAVLLAFDRTIGAAIAAEAAREKERGEAVTEDWLRSIGGFPDDSGDGTFYFAIWRPGEHTRPQKGFSGPFVHLWICSDGEYGFEEYDEFGDTTAIIDVGKVANHGEVNDLLRGLGIEPTKGGGA